jgi:protein-tyrosine phosphatase
MAVGLARKLFTGSSVVFESAGVDATDGRPPTADAVRAMDERGMDIRNHRSRGMDSLSLDRFTHLVAMTPGIAGRLSNVFSAPKDRIVEWNIPDPYGKGIDAYRECARRIVGALHEFTSTALNGAERVPVRTGYREARPLAR